MQPHYNICIVEIYHLVKYSNQYRIEAGNIEQFGHHENQ